MAPHWRGGGGVLCIKILWHGSGWKYCRKSSHCTSRPSCASSQLTVVGRVDMTTFNVIRKIGAVIPSMWTDFSTRIMKLMNLFHKFWLRYGEMNISFGNLRWAFYSSYCFFFSSINFTWDPATSILHWSIMWIWIGLLINSSWEPLKKKTDKIYCLRIFKSR